MAVPSSGALRLRGDIALEVDGSATGTDVSLGTLSNSAGFTEPDTMSEFYGYSSVSAPSVTTSAATSVTASSFTANGNATSDNGASITDRGFYIGTDSNYANNTKTSVGGSGTGTFTLNKTGLTYNQTYYITAYATNSIGEGRGSTITQNTANATAPSVNTNSNSSVSVTSMVANGNVTSDGGATITSRGFYFGTSSNYANNGKYTVSGTTGSFNRTMSGLNQSTTYYATAFAVNAVGESRGGTQSSTTSTPINYSVSTQGGYHEFEVIGGSSVVHSQYYSTQYDRSQYNHSQLGWTTFGNCDKGSSSGSGVQNCNYEVMTQGNRMKVNNIRAHYSGSYVAVRGYIRVYKYYYNSNNTETARTIQRINPGGWNLGSWNSGNVVSNNSCDNCYYPGSGTSSSFNYNVNGTSYMDCNRGVYQTAVTPCSAWGATSNQYNASGG
tara:strand:- start:1972 stop:3294 length:1323 start_codon:yes stop_codon:yes gene_type:complete